MDNNADYRTDSGYIYHYLDKLSPAFMRSALLLAGVDMPTSSEDRTFRYLELGFGQGLSLAINAATNPGEYWGVDFLPEHAAKAEAFAMASGGNITILNNTFAETAAMAGTLPQFDVIALHGVWSWINKENRDAILTVIDRTLKPGGIVYNSYNTIPGWSFFIPIRDLMMTVASLYDEGKVDPYEIIDYILAMAETKQSAYLLLNPFAVEYLASLKSESRDYIMHEFLNSSWENFPYSKVADAMHSVGCSFASSAFLQYELDNALRPKAADMIGQIIDPDIRESLKDFALNQKFRGDYFVRGPKEISPEEQWTRLSESRLCLARRREAIRLEVRFGVEKMDLRPELFEAFLDVLEADACAPKPLAEVFGSIASSPDNQPTLLECLRILMATNAVRFAQPAVDADILATSQNLNRELCRLVAEENHQGIHHLAAPTLGMGMTLPTNTMQRIHIHNRNGENADNGLSAAETAMLRNYGIIA